MPEQKTELTQEQIRSNTEKLRFMIVQQATIEVMNRHRDEILTLANTRLAELGLKEPVEVVK